MGPWATVIVVVAALAATFFAVMAWRGLVECFERYSGHCVGCGRTTLLPLSPQTHECRRCHHAARRAHRSVVGLRLIRH
jgi:rRNA maturation endonuclease Nob1